MGKNILANPVRNPNGPSPRRPAAAVREHGGSGSGHAGGTLNPDGKQLSFISNGVNDKGMALVVALMMLLVLTLIGIHSITSTTYEASISGNERVGTDAFYASESGIQVSLNQLPNTNPISRTKVGEDSYYWSGSRQDKNSPTSIKVFGLHPKAGFDSSWSFNRYQINATGESFGAVKEIEAQVSYGPFSTGTQYNN